jgi:hypothetical protein
LTINLIDGGFVIVISPRGARQMKDEIEEIANRFRAVVERFIEEHRDFNRSSRGLCIGASLALQRALEYEGYHQSRDVRGKFQGHGHAWVEVQGKIVDVTRDQYGYFPPVFVADAPCPDYKEVTGDEEFDKQMGPDGDKEVLYIDDDQGEKCLGESTISIADKLFALYTAQYPKTS